MSKSATKNCFSNDTEWHQARWIRGRAMCEAASTRFGLFEGSEFSGGVSFSKREVISQESEVMEPNSMRLLWSTLLSR